ncbi:MAG: endonuclease III [Akkermansia sp.]|nr:endonuclease III [Akkermansia sp.]
MNTEKRASIVQEELMSLYGAPPIPLVHRDAYTLLVAVLLSAQCTDKRVNLVTPALFALASTPEEMARQDVAAVREIVRPCGLSERKASAIVNLSRILVEKYSGKVPCDFAALESLPGGGHKTASVVMGQAFGVPAFPVDTHIFRLSRLWGLSTGKTVEAVERDLKSLFPEKLWGDLHLRIVLYGREYCPARGCGGAAPSAAGWPGRAAAQASEFFTGSKMMLASLNLHALIHQYLFEQPYNLNYEEPF